MKLILPNYRQPKTISGWTCCTWPVVFISDKLPINEEPPQRELHFILSTADFIQTINVPKQQDYRETMNRFFVGNSSFPSRLEIPTAFASLCLKSICIRDSFWKSHIRRLWIFISFCCFRHKITQRRTDCQTHIRRSFGVIKSLESPFNRMEFLSSRLLARTMSNTVGHE